MGSRFTIALMAALIAAQPAAGAPGPISVTSDAVWDHAQSGIQLGPQLAGFERTEVRQYDADGYNVAATLKDAATDTEATLYVFRSGEPDVAIWADRAREMIITSDRLGRIDPAAVVAGPYSPPGGIGEGSGFGLVAPLTGKALRSTGLLLFALDGWLIKMRATSAILDAQALHERMQALMSEVTLPQVRPNAARFAPIEDCPSPLSFKKKAKLVRLDMTGTIMLGAMLSAAADKEGEAPAAPVVWCRDTSTREYAIYRANGSDDSYILAFNDAGLTAAVDKFDAGGLMSPSRGYLISVSDGASQETLPPFTAMPGPELVASAISSVSPFTRRNVRPGAKKDITINVGAQ